MSRSEPERVLIIGSQLSRARELLQLTPEEVAREISVSAQDIVSWEKAKLKPNFKKLELLAKLYGREIDYFLKETPAPPEKIEFRGKLGQNLSSLSKEARIVLARFDELCRTALEFEGLLNKRRDIKLPKFEESKLPKMVAHSLRRIFDIGDKPLPDLRNRLEDEGIRIFELPVPGDAFSGFSFWHLEYGPCILVNATEPKGRRNFTLAHELAHLLYRHGSSLCYIPLYIGIIYENVEYKANQVAIELLLPQLGVVENFRKKNISDCPSEPDLAPIASKWGVSVQALGYRLENLGLIKRGVTDKIVESRPTHFRRPKTPTWERQLGERFVETSIEAYQRGLISTGKLAHSLGITVRKTLEDIERRTRQQN